MPEVYLSEECGRPIRKKQSYVVPNRATAKSRRQWNYIHLRCVTRKRKATSEEAREVLREMLRDISQPTRDLIMGRGQRAGRQRLSPEKTRVKP